MLLQPPPSDSLAGQIVRLEKSPHVALVVGETPDAPPGDLLHQGAVIVRYGLALLYERDYLLVQWAYDDFRREYHGAAAIDFIIRHGDPFPRADVVGQRVSTGQRADLFLKQLDPARGLFAFAYATREAARPVARLDAVVWVEAGAVGLAALAVDDARAAPLLRQAVPCLSVGNAALSRLGELLAAWPR
jgi:hypothetical protein